MKENSPSKHFQKKLHIARTKEKSHSLTKFNSWENSTIRTSWNSTKYMNRTTQFMSVWSSLKVVSFMISSKINTNLLNNRLPMLSRGFFRDLSISTPKESCIVISSLKISCWGRKTTLMLLLWILDWQLGLTSLSIFSFGAGHLDMWHLKSSISKTWKQNAIQSAISLVWVWFVTWCLQANRLFPVRLITKYWPKIGRATSTSRVMNAPNYRISVNYAM